MSRGYVSLIIIVCLICFVPYASMSQRRAPVRANHEDTRLGFGLSAGVATGFNYTSSVTAQLRWQHDFSPYISGLLSASYTSFFSGSSVADDATNRFSMVPLKAGMKIFPLPRVYLAEEFGLAFTPDQISTTSFAFSSGLGFEFYEGLDLGVSYDKFRKFEVANIAFKISYGFDLTRHSGYDAF